MATRTIAAILLLLGTNIVTYAFTRQRTTERVLQKVTELTEAFLENNSLTYGPGNADKKNLAIPEKTYLASKALLARISWAGGMYHWWNDALPYYGLGILLCSIGLMLPCVKPRHG